MHDDREKALVFDVELILIRPDGREGESAGSIGGCFALGGVIEEDSGIGFCPYLEIGEGLSIGIEDDAGYFLAWGDTESAQIAALGAEVLGANGKIEAVEMRAFDDVEFELAIGIGLHLAHGDVVALLQAGGLFVADGGAISHWAAGDGIALGVLNGSLYFFGGGELEFLEPGLLALFYVVEDQ